MRILYYLKLIINSDLIIRKSWIFDYPGEVQDYYMTAHIATLLILNNTI